MTIMLFLWFLFSQNLNPIMVKSIRHLDIRSGEHIGVSPLTEKKVKESNNSAICDHLLRCNFLPSFDNFSVFSS